MDFSKSSKAALQWAVDNLLITDDTLAVHYVLQRKPTNGGDRWLGVHSSSSTPSTEETFMDCADMMASEIPELALMRSCVLVMLMLIEGEDVYLMNVGDSRAVRATKGRRRDLRRNNEFEMDELLDLAALQLTLDHCTSVKEEVVRIRNKHPDDNMAIANDRVKGSLKVTRAFRAGFLKQANKLQATQRVQKR